MSETKDGGPAFPRNSTVFGDPGMSLHEWYAGNAPEAPDAFEGSLPSWKSAEPPLEWMARRQAEWAWAYADAMMVERNKRIAEKLTGAGAGK